MFQVWIALTLHLSTIIYYGVLFYRKGQIVPQTIAIDYRVRPWPKYGFFYTFLKTLFWIPRMFQVCLSLTLHLSTIIYYGVLLYRKGQSVPQTIARLTHIPLNPHYMLDREQRLGHLKHLKHLNLAIHRLLQRRFSFLCCLTWIYTIVFQWVGINCRHVGSSTKIGTI